MKSLYQKKILLYWKFISDEFFNLETLKCGTGTNYILNTLCSQILVKSIFPPLSEKIIFVVFMTEILRLNKGKISFIEEVRRSNILKKKSTCIAF